MMWQWLTADDKTESDDEEDKREREREIELERQRVRENHLLTEFVRAGTRKYLQSKRSEADEDGLDKKVDSMLQG